MSMLFFLKPAYPSFWPRENAGERDDVVDDRKRKRKKPKQHYTGLEVERRKDEENMMLLLELLDEWD